MLRVLLGLVFGRQGSKAEDSVEEDEGDEAEKAAPALLCMDVMCLCACRAPGRQEPAVKRRRAEVRDEAHWRQRDVCSLCISMQGCVHDRTALCSFRTW